MMTIGRCRTADVPDVLAFLDAHWKPGHIFTRDRTLFDWQYARRDRPEEYNIAIARRDGERAIVGMLGFIPTRHYDPSLASNNSLWLALWKVRDDAAAGPVGLRLLADVTDNEPHCSVGVIGFQPPVAAIYTALKFQVGELQQYVLLNPDISTFALASFERPPRPPVSDTRLTAIAVNDNTFAAAAAELDPGSRAGRIPLKTAAYFRARYLQHPVYRYRAFVLHDGGRAKGLLAVRVASHGGHHAVRIVDFIGPDEMVPALGACVLAMVRESGAEYADLHNWGIDPALFEAAGFSRVDPAGSDIVPNHFEPFERRSAPIRFALKSSRPAVLFKGDGDQDRPNQPAS